MILGLPVPLAISQGWLSAEHWSVWLNPSLFLFSASWRSWVVYAALVAIAAAVLFGNLRHHPVGIDDASTFRDNVATSDDFSYFFGLPAAKELGSGRPLAEFTKWVAYAVWGNDAGAYHLRS